MPEQLSPLEQAIRNNPCQKCSKLRLAKCMCGPAAGGGGAGDEIKMSDERPSKSSTERSDLDVKSDKVTSGGKTTPATKDSEQHTHAFDVEIIAELLSKKLLQISNNPGSGILLIKLMCEPRELTSQQRTELNKYIAVILKEFDTFTNEKNLSLKDSVTHQKDAEGNTQSLSIKLPRPEIYDAFIKHLNDRNLLSLQTTATPTPFSTKPRPGSAPRPRTPLDGLKPKGGHE